MSRKCFNCGALLEDDEMFCGDCGAKQNKELIDKSISSTEEYIQVKKDNPHPPKKKKVKSGCLISLIILILLLVIISLISENPTTEENIEKNNYDYFDIVDMINKKNFDEALERINEVYSKIDYSDSSDGFNKMNLLRLYYEKQEMFEEALKVVEAFLSESSHEIKNSYKLAINMKTNLEQIIQENNPAQTESTNNSSSDNYNNNSENSNKTHTICSGYTIEAGTAFSDGVAFVAIQKNNIFSIVAIDKNGKILYTLRDNINGEYYSVSLNDIEGYRNKVLVIGNNIYNKKGNIIASPDTSGYDEVYISNSIGVANIDGYIIVRKHEDSIDGEKHLVGVINNAGNWEIPLSEEGIFVSENCKFSWTNDVEETLWYDKKDFIISEEYIENSSEVYNSSSKQYLSKYNIIDSYGINCVNNYLLFLAHNGAGSNYLCFLDDKGERVIEPIKLEENDDYYPLDENGFVFRKWNDSHNYITYFCDFNGKITEYGELTAFYAFSEGLALIIDERGNMCYINHNGKVIIK